MSSSADGLEDIRMQAMWNRLIAVVEEQARTLMRTAFSTVVREAGDLSAGLFDRRGRMIAQAVTGTPGHVNSMADGVAHFLAKYPIETMVSGDHFITNDPWLTSGHLHDVTVVSPVFRNGRAIALFACTCHQVDIGGLGQGPDGRSVFEEGLYIPIMHLARAGVVNADLLEIVRGNVRTPIEVEADILSYMNANETSAVRLDQMMHEFGLEDLEPLAELIVARSHDAMIAAIDALTPGTYENTMTVDGVGTPLRLSARLTIGGGRILIDYVDCPPASARGINLVMNYTRAYSAFGVRCVVGADIPNNAGSLSPIEVRAPAGSLLNVARPAPVSARAIIGLFLPDVVLGCLAQAMPERIPAEGAAALWAVQVRGGPEVSAGSGAPAGTAFDMIFFNSGGAGARPCKDGLNATAFPSGVRAQSVEVIETQGPIVVWRKELRPGSGGRGTHRGGLGQTIEIASREDVPLALFAMYDRVVHAARGRAGGEPGAVGRVALASGRTLQSMGRQIIPAGERLVLELPGGGGHGPPAARDPARDAADIEAGLAGEPD